jgi:hypothetical protein
MQIRRQSWAIAGMFLIAFCWLGFAAVSVGALFKGFGEMNLPVRLGSLWLMGQSCFHCSALRLPLLSFSRKLEAAIHRCNWL